MAYGFELCRLKNIHLFAFGALELESFTVLRFGNKASGLSWFRILRLRRHF